MALALSLLAGVAPGTVRGQSAAQADLSSLATELSDQVRHLVQDIQGGLGPGAATGHLVREGEELARAVDDFAAAVRSRPDRRTLARSFASIDGAWDHLSHSLDRVGVTPGIGRGIERVNRVETALRQALGLGVPGDLADLSMNLGQQVLRLSEDIQADLGASPIARNLVKDCQELGLTVYDFRTTVERDGDRYTVRRAFSRIDSSWANVLDGLRRVGSTPVVDRSARIVGDQIAEIRAMLDLDPPHIGPTPQPIPPELAEAQRLALAMQRQAESALLTIQRELGSYPDSYRVLNDASQLVQAADTLEGLLDDGRMPSNDRIASAYGVVARLSARIESAWARNPPPRSVLGAWQAFQRSRSLLQRQLAIPDPVPPIPPPRPDPGRELRALTDSLANDAASFVGQFAPSAGRVPEGGAILNDATRLRWAALGFQQSLQRGEPMPRLAAKFSQVDETYSRLARRVGRIAAGRPGPNIDQVRRIGDTVARIHDLLGIPSYAPTLPGAPY
jgi:hypothetical protein